MFKRSSMIEMFKITVGTAIVAVAVHFFLVPGRLAVASISGLALVLSQLIALPVSVITLILNVALLILGFLLVGREFGGKTVYTSILLPLFINVLERFFPDQASLTNDQFVDMVAYVITVSIGLAILFTCNASSGGLDIVAKLLSKFLHMELGTAMTAAGIVTSLTAIVVYDLKTVIISLIGTYLNGLVLDNFIFGIDTKKRVCIISKEMEKIRTFILEDLHSSASIYQNTGAYSNETRPEIITIVDKNEYRRLMNYITQIDSNAFVAVYNVNKVLYRH